MVMLTGMSLNQKSNQIKSREATLHIISSNEQWNNLFIASRTGNNSNLLEMIIVTHDIPTQEHLSLVQS